ncbi:MAG: hypothetical protein ACLQDM_23220 [Bradyrhizobium sp.]
MIDVIGLLRRGGLIFGADRFEADDFVGAGKYIHQIRHQSFDGVGYIG